MVWKRLLHQTRWAWLCPAEKVRSWGLGEEGVLLEWGRLSSQAVWTLLSRIGAPSPLFGPCLFFSFFLQFLSVFLLFPPQDIVHLFIHPCEFCLLFLPFPLPSHPRPQRSASGCLHSGRLGQALWRPGLLRGPSAGSPKGAPHARSSGVLEHDSSASS